MTVSGPGQYHDAMNPENVVRDFCAVFARRDLEELLGFFSADAIYHNMPMDPVQGHAAIRATLGFYLSAATTEAEFEVLALAASGRTVLTERIDRFAIGGKSVALPVMGAFEVTADGKIAAWRDYFDMAQFSAQLS